MRPSTAHVLLLALAACAPLPADTPPGRPAPGGVALVRPPGLKTVPLTSASDAGAATAAALGKPPSVTCRTVMLPRKVILPGQSYKGRRATERIVLPTEEETICETDDGRFGAVVEDERR